jgi:serine protease AprX
MNKNISNFKFTFIPIISIFIIVSIVTIPLTNAIAIDSTVKLQFKSKSKLDTINLSKTPGQVIHPHLEKILDSCESDDQLEVIIQFQEKVMEKDLDFLTLNNIEIIHQYSVIPALHVKGSKAAIMVLEDYDRTFWMEYNEPIDWCMEQSLLTINATHAWNSMVIDEFGNSVSPIDGTGVTVVVLDTGIDAGHPDLDYQEKTLVNLKSDFGAGPWVDMEDSDTSYGHGTHCAGTVAGNGEASSGARRGVAPGANLIGLSIGDVGVNLANTLGGYEWIYNNAHRYPNVRVISNSWGTSGAGYDPNNALSKIIEDCAIDKNIVSVFAAGNAGENNHDGSTITTNPYASVPLSISIAATERDGSGMAYFSSRGQIDKIDTWPDVGAPGVNIWSTAARRTYIGIMVRGSNLAETDPYYFAISGTSMATPHVSGAVALLFQACPSLKISDQRDDHKDNDTAWLESNRTFVHEAELILEASAEYIKPQGDNGVPGNSTIGWTGGKNDYAQGYGLINARKAVAIALTLNELRTRDFNGDGSADYTNATVYDAIKQYQNIMTHEPASEKTNTLITEWSGEWTRFTNQSTGASISTDQSHFVYIPEESTKLILDLKYERISTSEGLKGALVRMVIDYDGDGEPDWPESITEYEEHYELDLTSGSFSQHRGKIWNFNVEGLGFNLGQIIGNPIGSNFYEVTVEFKTNLKIILDVSEDDVSLEFEEHSPKFAQFRFGPPTEDYSRGEIMLPMFYFDLTKVEPLIKPEPPSKHEEDLGWLLWLVLLIILTLILVAIGNYYNKKRNVRE